MMENARNLQLMADKIISYLPEVHPAGFERFEN